MMRPSRPPRLSTGRRSTLRTNVMSESCRMSSRSMRGSARCLRLSHFWPWASSVCRSVVVSIFVLSLYSRWSRPFSPRFWQILTNFLHSAVASGRDACIAPRNCHAGDGLPVLQLDWLGFVLGGDGGEFRHRSPVRPWFTLDDLVERVGDSCASHVSPFSAA